MEWIAMICAGLALLVSIAALVRSNGGGSAAADQLERIEQDARRRTENLAEETEQKLVQLRQMLVRVHNAEPLTEQMILDGQLWRDVSPEEGKQMVSKGGVRIVDVRTPGETQTGIVPGALLIPIDALEERMSELPKDGKPTLVYCAGGGRSAAACEFLSAQGYKSLHNLEGGMGAWSGPTVKP